MSTAPHTSLDTLADALGRVWLDNQLSEAQASGQAAVLVGVHADRLAATHLQALSLAFQSLRTVLMRPSGARDCLPVTAELLDRVSALGCARATLLAEVAWVFPRFFDGCEASRVQALVQRWPAPPGKQAGAAASAQAAEGPAIERVWVDATLCTIHCIEGQHERALACGLRAWELAQQARHAFSGLIVAQNLAFLYLSVGDVEAAEAMLAESLLLQRRCGFSRLGPLINLLLTLLLRRSFDAAAAWLEGEEGQALLGQPHGTSGPMVQALVARVRLAQGRPEDAARLPTFSWAPGSAEPHTLAANRLWVCADVLTGLGRPAEARAQLQAGLQVFEQASVKLLPMNSTQLQRALADACEAAGDLPGALAALRRSQAHCYTWVGQSLRLRMQMLHDAADQGDDGATQRRQQERLAQVERTLQAAQVAQSAQAGEPTALATPPGGHRLLARVTHEVRNPLHGVVWMTSLLMMSDLDERQREYLTLAHSSARVALELCNDVLDLARIDAGKLQLKTEALDLAALLAECSSLYEPAAQAKGLALRWQGDPALPPLVLGDRLRLQQVLMNLLSNATKFTSAGRIDLHVAWLGESLQPQAAAAPTVRLSVTDTGPGVPADLLPRLFEEFEQGGGPAAVGGTGLGLALCRQLVRLMGGDIGVDTQPGQGCSFWCLLPLPRA